MHGDSLKELLDGLSKCPRESQFEELSKMYQHLQAEIKKKEGDLGKEVK